MLPGLRRNISDHISKIISHSGMSAACCICEKTFKDIVDAVIHIHEEHGILGGSQLVMLGGSWIVLLILI